MRRPGFGSAFVRLVISAWSLLWLAGMPEMLEVWGDAYTIPSEIALPKATVWVVAVLMVATAWLLGSGWWQRRRGAVSLGTRLADRVLAGLHGLWAALFVWSFVLFQRELAESDGFYVAGPWIYFELVFAAMSVASAVLLFRDSRAATAADPRRDGSPEGVEPVSPPLLLENVARFVLAAAFLGLLLALPVYLGGWSVREPNWGNGVVSAPWGPLLLALTFGASAALLVLSWRWQRSLAAPARAAAWSWCAAALQAFWATLVLVAWLFEPHALAKQIAFGYGGYFSVAVLVGLGVGAAILHDRDARRMGGLSSHVAEPAVLVS